MKNNRHVFLINEKANNPKFKRQRGWKNKEEDDPVVEPQPKFIKDFQKERFRSDNISFYSQKKLRFEIRTVVFPKYIELIKIYFHTIFNTDLLKKFEERYGLSPVSYSHFNKTVDFEILNEDRFKNFETHIEMVINSPDETPYANQPFNLIALILKFEFIDANYRLLTSRESGILVTLISSSNIVFNEQKASLISYLFENGINHTYNQDFPDIIEIESIESKNTKFLADNFDIIQMIASTRTLKVRPGIYGPVRRDFGFKVNVPTHVTKVGVIDTGINRIDPLRELISTDFYDHTNMGAFWDESGHGTMVAGLVILGDEFQKVVSDNYIAKARIIAIKAIHNNDDSLNLPKLLSDIRDAKYRYGVRLFNMSLNIPTAKLYNDTYSHFAYELDKLAYEDDILIFLSVGNFDPDNLYELLTIEMNPDHEYPTFFYKLNGTSQVHRCQNTNISEPSESLNNISVGAIAGNLEHGDNSDFTPNSLSPAYYTRKFHFDYSQAINKQPLRRNQNNKHLNKPDLVFEGGDVFNYEAGIEVLRSPLADGEKYFGRSSGTSLATPLITSYAAEILNTYPNLRTQTVKGLLINSASYHKKSDLPEFKYSSEILLKSLVGFGKPEKQNLISSQNNSIVFVIEDRITISEIISIPIILPQYLKDTGNKLQFDITLCYSFLPVKDNHLNYLPLHISFNLIKNTDIKTVAEKDQKDYGIKTGFTWSEDHHGIENRIFSNAQNKSYVLQSNDLNVVNDSVALGIRCLSKEQIPPTHLEHIKGKKHDFSIIVRITEVCENAVNSQLYSEMIVCNEILNISELEGDASAELELI